MSRKNCKFLIFSAVNTRPLVNLLGKYSTREIHLVPNCTFTFSLSFILCCIPISSFFENSPFCLFLSHPSFFRLFFLSCFFSSFFFPSSPFYFPLFSFPSFSLFASFSVSYFHLCLFSPPLPPSLFLAVFLSFLPPFSLPFSLLPH